MPNRTRDASRRTDALSHERIIDAAVSLLDADGEDGLTFRRLADVLRTGPGAIYHHVANKDQLLSDATDVVVNIGDADFLADTDGDATTHAAAIRSIAEVVFDAVDAHPWAGAQLARGPLQPAMLRIFEAVGRRVVALGVPDSAAFTCVTAVTNYMLGAAGLNAANARVIPPGSDRSVHLSAAAAAWGSLDPADYPFTRAVAEQMRRHDDREQFLDGIDLILDGIVALGHKKRTRDPRTGSGRSTRQ